MDDRIILKSEKLEIRVLPHGHADYARMRFDWTGIVDEVMLDGKFTFASAESPNPNHPSSGGLGFCNEFQCPGTFDDAGVGDAFIKFGIGALKRVDDTPYSFMRDYPVDPFKCETVITDDSVTFTLMPREINGYAASLRKMVKVDGNAMVISYTFKNEGVKTINFREYNHNFVAINKQPIGKAYKLNINFVDQAELDKAKPPFAPFNGGLGVAQTDRVNLMHVISSGIIDRDQYIWELTHDEEPVGMREIETWKPAGISVWGIGHVISPEVFYAASLKAGETAAWERRWEFFYK